MTCNHKHKRTVIITLSIDCTLVDKTRIKEIKRKNGKVAKFIDLVLIESPNSDYGDFMVKQQVTKEEREQGVQLPILGNARTMVKGGGGQPRGAAANSGDSYPPQGDSGPPF